MSRITIETRLVQGIPALTMAPETSEPCPIVFFLHGFTSDKSQGLALGYELAKSGFHFVSFDAYLHGDRFDERLGDIWSGKGDYVYPFECGLDAYLLMFEIILQVAKDLEILIAHFGESKRVDRDKIGLTGFSMGGFATFYVASRNPHIRVAVPIAGIPAFAARWSDVVLESSAYDKWSVPMAEAQAETVKRTIFMEEIDPFERMVSFHPKPLMIVVGDQDIDSPKKYSVDLYRELKPHYEGCPDRLRLSIHDEAGHELTLAMIRETCGWFCRYLLEQNAA